MSLPRLKSFQDVVSQYNLPGRDSIKFLPLCHTTLEGYMENILTSGILSPQPCDKYENRKLLYFFYGKASYNPCENLDTFLDNAPISILYSMDNIVRCIKESKACNEKCKECHLDGGSQKCRDCNFYIERSLPFDSGGIDRLKFPPGFGRENFTLKDPLNKMLDSCVRLIYSDNGNYLDDKVDIENLKKHFDECFAIRKLVNMYEKLDAGSLDAGRQAYTIEVQFSSEIEFCPDYIILPYDQFTDSIWELIQSQYPGIRIVPYGMDEISLSRGKRLKVGEYKRLMEIKVNEIVKGLGA